MKNHFHTAFREKYQLSTTRIFKVLLFILVICQLGLQDVYSQSGSSDAFEHTCLITFLDGTPIMRGFDTDDFSLDLDRAPDLYAAYVKEVKNGNITFLCSVAGKYTLKFMGIEIAKFEVLKNQEEFSSNLPDQLKLPFNYLVVCKPNKAVKIYDDNIKLIQTLETNDEGILALKENAVYFSNKFLVTEAEDHFPSPAFFKEIKPINTGKLSNRRLRLSTSQIIAKRGVVHNISTDTYYTKRELAFTKEKKLALLFVYEAKDQKTIISKLNLDAYPNTSSSEIILDEIGRPVLNLKKRMGSSSKYEYISLIVSKNGNLQVDDKTFVYPAYRFKDNFVQNTRWIISTFKNIALTEGAHNFRISCNGSWMEPNSGAAAHNKLAGEIAELVAEINKASQEKRDIGNSKSLLLNEKREQKNKLPPAPPIKKSGSLNSSESFNVFLSPFSNLFWKMDSPLNTENGNVDSIAYNVKCIEKNPAVKAWNERRSQINSNRSLDSKTRQEAMKSLGKFPTPECLKYDSTAYYYTRRYRPSGYDPDSKLAKENPELKDCIIELDGEIFGYSYTDPYAGKGIMYADWDSEEQKQKAMASALKNATVYMGFEGNMESGYDGWGKNIDLFDKSWNLISSEPINSWEGPYPDLRYGIRENLGAYENMKEARKHCKTPSWNYNTKKYHCYEEKVVTICFDNYQYSIDENGRVQTNYDALYCGEMEPEENNLKGEEIAVDVSAEGYISTSRALLKRDMEISEVEFSGHVLDKEDSPIENAKVGLRGYNKETITDSLGQFSLYVKTKGTDAYAESMDIKLQKIGIEVANEELGVYNKDKPYGLVSDGFTTLKLKVKAKGIRPQTVIVKQPVLGNFVEQSVLKVPLVLDADGEGEMEYVPPAYLKSEQLTKHLQTNVDPNNQYGLLSQIWVAEVPIEITYEDEEGNPGSFTLKIMVSRPPIFLMHGFTGDETTWATLGNYLRGLKYETYAQEYYRGLADESTIQRQSEKLGFYIQKIRESYLALNILQTRIDIVAHSMGGLMSRYYINNMSKYGEKAGVVIPYDVKLSREQLAAARNKAPVKLIDVRKLIMVGTPNHGASKIDEIFGVVGALTSDYHQLANGQLRSDSEFFKTLNEGESEGRHLDPNVQYALLYGIRKRSEFYPPDRLLYPWQTSQKNFADDDGVVKVSSAILNGILNIPFPKDWFAMHGFIHSPAMESFFMGDEAITESTSIFEEINILLQEDIKRTPLKNSYAKIVRSDGDAYMKYFSTENWKAIGPTPIKLRDHWCQIKTDEGSASLGFFLDGHHWGSLHIMENTIAFYEYASPEFVKVYLQKGKARFRSRKQEGGGFEVVMGDEGEKWYEFNPKAKVRDVNTDFTIEESDVVRVQSLNGKVSMGLAGKDPASLLDKTIGTNQGVKIIAPDKVETYDVPESGWWSDIDTAFLDNELLDTIHFSDNLIVNGGFEEGPEVSSYHTLRAGDSIPGWKVTQATVDLTGTYFASAEGNISIDLVGTPGYGAISQKLTTIPGEAYQLSFQMSGNPAGAPQVKHMQVSAADHEQEFFFDVSEITSQNMGWQPNSWVFKATEELTTLSFIAIESSPPTNYGPAIDDIEVIQLTNEQFTQIPIEEKVIALQEVGSVTIDITEDYLPISGFANIEINALNITNEPLTSPYQVEVSFANHELMHFVEIGTPQGVIDESGHFKTIITISEPELDDYTSLMDIPLSTTLNIDIRNPRSKGISYDTTFEIPLGMTLLKGITVGPDFKPRQEPVAPEFYDPSYQLANQADEKGNFYILFNMSLYEKDVERLKKLSHRKQEIFTNDIFDFSIEWSRTSSLPLKYNLDKKLINQIAVGRDLWLNKQEQFDLLTPEEHEGRIRDMLISFSEKLPLITNNKTRLIDGLKMLTFTYGSDSDRVVPKAEAVGNRWNIHTMTHREEFWTAEFNDSSLSPSYLLMLHAGGHVLYNALVSENNHTYQFLSGKCHGEKSRWTHDISDQSTLFDPTEYISFHEAGVDFFTYLIYAHIAKKHTDFVNQSIYFNRGYLSEFEKSDPAIDARSKYPGYAVSGPQPRFLIEFYGEACHLDPVGTYSSFISDQLIGSRGYNIAKKFGDWLKLQQSRTDNDEIRTLAETYGLNKSSDGIFLYPLSKIQNALIEINGILISDFANIPVVNITNDSHIKVLEGSYLLERINSGNTSSTTLLPTAEVFISSDGQLDYKSGVMISSSPFSILNNLAEIESENFEIYVTNEKEDIAVYVIDGIVEISSKKSERKIIKKEYVTINQKGKIKKPKEISTEMYDSIIDQVRKTYPIADPFLFDELNDQMTPPLEN